MKCDNCGEDIGTTVINRPDGQKWCHACARIEKRKPKNPKRARTTDRFILTARALHDIYCPWDRHPWAEIVMARGDKRAYTNGHVLITEMPKTPEKYKLVNVDTLWKVEDERKYPAIEKFTGKPAAGSYVRLTIPEDFYQYAKAFGKPRPRRMEVRVKIRKDEIAITDGRDYSEMHYREFQTFDGGEADFDYLYMMALKPKEIMVEDAAKPVQIESTYEKGLENCKAIVLMPMGKDR